MTAEQPKKPRKNPGTPFKKGVDPRRNTAGAPHIDVQINEIKSDLRNKIAINLQKYHDSPIGSINDLMKTPGLTIGEAMVLSFLKHGIVVGCPKRMGILANIVELSKTSAPTINLDINNEPRQITMRDVMEALAKDKMLNKENEECITATYAVTTPKPK